VKINIPKTVTPLELSEYSHALTEQMFVWVNPPRSLINQFAEIFNDPEIGQDEKFEAIKKWLSEIWSQGAEGTHWTVDEVAEMFESTKETDPQFYPWLFSRTMQMIAEHRGIVKKV